MVNCGTRGIWSTALAVAGCCIVAGCGSGAESTGGSPGAPQEGAPAAAEEGGTPIDACALISPEEITALLGVAVEGQGPGPTTEGPNCLWENPDNYESVSVQIGSPRTAVNGTLGPPEPGMPEVGTPGPDGMRFIGPGAVEFPAAGRANMVQVAVLSKLGNDEASNAAVDLARKIGPQLPQ